jgi:glycosyltransferase involved in cell wall biosynthesis
VQPFVSIVIPTKNCEKTIEGLLKSIKKLNYKNYEVIVVDSSNDKTAEIVKKFKVRLFTICFSKKRTANKQRNIGTKKAKGEIIAFTDGDCKVHRNWLKELVKGFDGDIGIVGGSIKSWGKSFFKRYHQLAFRTGIPKINREKTLNKEDFFKKQLFTRYELPVAMNMAIKRKIFKKIGYFDEGMDYLEENEFFWRLFSKSDLKIKTIPKAIVYHDHASGIGLNIKKYFKSGKGVGIFCKKYLTSSFTWHRVFLLSLFLISLVVFFITLFWNPIYSLILAFASILPTMPHSIRVAINKKTPSAITFPFFDILLCAFVYNFGILYGLLHGK